MCISKKQEILFNFLEKYKDLPKQGSSEWLEKRKSTIGGSEISTILGVNPYQNIKALAKNKVGLTTFKKAPPLWFGSLLEMGLERYIEKKFNTSNYETGSIVNDKYNTLSYSPDGLAVININKLKNIFSNNDIKNILNDSPLNGLDSNELIVLFEFKSPFCRKPVKGKVPEYYISQPLLGMETIQISEVSLFIECVFRFCSEKDLLANNSKYNRWYHYDKEKIINDVISFSAITLYCDSDNEVGIKLLQTITDYSHTNYYSNGDISSITDKKIINFILEDLIDKKNIKFKYHNVYLNELEDFNSEEEFYFHKHTNKDSFIKENLKIKEQIKNDGYTYIGKMCYKIFDCNINPIYKKKILSNDVLSKIDNFISVIKKCENVDEIKKNIYINNLL